MNISNTHVRTKRNYYDLGGKKLTGKLAKHLAYFTTHSRTSRRG